MIGFKGQGVLESLSVGTSTSYITVSIQKRDIIRGAKAFDFSGGDRHCAFSASVASTRIGACVPARKGMFVVPPPLGPFVGSPVVTSKVIVFSISWPSMARARTRLEFAMISVVIVLASIYGLRFCCEMFVS